ncbi:MAG TPA: hypothetical protein VMT82_08620 [candidate division Zixibacteria bacterium]|nr:hypothetical protein [candidate division Zixibacteria bacterium]
MKSFAKLAAVLLLAFAASAAFAGANSSLSIHIYENVTIAGTAVPAGEYKMQIDRTGDAVKFSLMRGKTAVVQVPARFEERKFFSTSTAVVSRNAQVREIQIEKLKGAVVFDGDETAKGN